MLNYRQVIERVTGAYRQLAIPSGTFALLLGILLMGCDKEHADPDNFAFALKDGQEWTAIPSGAHRLHFGDSSIILSLGLPSDDGISKEAIVFYYVPLLIKEFSVIDTTLRDSVSVSASYLLLNAHGDVIADRLHPSKACREQAGYRIV